MDKKMKKLLQFLSGFFMLNIIWLIASLLLQTKALPNPFYVYKNFKQVIQNGIFLHVSVSLFRIFGGILISLLIGIPIGLKMAQSDRWNQWLYPLIYFSYPIPKTALMPVAMLLLGLGNSSKLAIMVLTIVFQVIITVRDGANHIDEGYYQVAVSAGASKKDLLYHITIPAVMPELFTNLRINMGTSLAILFIVEAYGTRLGIGYYILDSWSRINYIEMYGGIIVIAVVGAGLFLLIDIISEKIPFMHFIQSEKVRK